MTSGIGFNGQVSFQWRRAKKRVKEGSLNFVISSSFSSARAVLKEDVFCLFRAQSILIHHASRRLPASIPVPKVDVPQTPSKALCLSPPSLLSRSGMGNMDENDDDEDEE